MKVIRYDKKFNFKKPILILGAFETFHKGHFELLKFAKSLPHNEIVIFTFSDYSQLLKSKVQFRRFNSLEDNLQVLSNLDIDYTILANFNLEFKNLHYSTFIKKIINLYNIHSIVIGNDFKFGFNRMGNAEKLKNLFPNTFILNLYKINNKKVSSSLIKELIEFGDISTANSLLMQKWRITALPSNLSDVKFSSNQLLPQPGIYIVNVIFKNMAYPSYLHINLQNKLIVKTLDNELMINNLKFEIEWLSRYRVIIKESQDGLLDYEVEKIKIYFLQKNNKI